MNGHNTLAYPQPPDGRHRHQPDHLEWAAILTVIERFAAPMETSDQIAAQLARIVPELGYDDRSDFDASEALGDRRHWLRSLPYPEYLKTEHWYAIRVYALDRAGRACALCASPYSLHVHHRTYANLGDERPEDVTVLCAPCHRLFHEYRRIT